MNITVLCKVVDNFGDIGVTWRLARQLKKENPSVCINLIADNLDSFNKICSKINPVEHFQVADGVCVYDWNAYEFCKTEFSKNDGEKLAVILECFQCGRPDWMEKILFDEKLERTVQIIMTFIPCIRIFGYQHSGFRCFGFILTNSVPFRL